MAIKTLPSPRTTMDDPPSEEFLQTAEDLLTFLQTGHPKSAPYAHLQNALESYKSSFPGPNSKNRHNKSYPKYNFPVEWAERAGIAKRRASRWHKEHLVIEKETELEEQRKAAEQAPEEKPAPTFTKFLQLPAEVRNLIWEAAITPRIIPMLPYWGNGNYENKMFELRAYVRPCALSGVCRESRKILFRRQTVRDPVPMDPERDTPYIMGSKYDDFDGRSCVVHLRGLSEFASIAVDELASFHMNSYSHKPGHEYKPCFPKLRRFTLVKHNSAYWDRDSGTCDQMELLQRKLEVTFEDPRDRPTREIWKKAKKNLARQDGHKFALSNYRLRQISTGREDGRDVETDVKIARFGRWRCCTYSDPAIKEDHVWSQWKQEWPEDIDTKGHSEKWVGGHPWELRMRILKNLVWDDQKPEESD